MEAVACGTALAVVEGSVIGEITPKKVEKEELDLIYATSTKQMIQELKGGPTDTLKYGADEVTLKSKFVLKFEEVAPGVEVT
jgi:hypothetical protein